VITSVWQGPLNDVAIFPALRAAALDAAAAGAELLVCPEMVTTGYHIGEAATRRLAEPADGPTSARIADLAVEAGLAIAYGYPESADGNLYNSVRLVDATGARLAGYRKTHLFGEIDRDRFTPGEQAVVQADLNGFRVGLMICYDVEFPELVRAHALAGTELLLVPTALMSPYEIVADALVPARAYENQLYVVYANRRDVEHELTYCGRSCVVAPTGAVLARAERETPLITAEVDRATIRASRAENTHLTDRRPELYRAIEGTSP
jgi:predicted amidohydrolase